MKRSSRNETTCVNSKNPCLPSSLLDQYSTIQVPIGESCLFWATVLAYLAGLKNDKNFPDEESYEITFSLACRNLFGKTDKVLKIKNLIDHFYSVLDIRLIQFNSTLIDLVTSVFHKRVVDFMHEDKRESEIDSMVKLLGCNIRVFDLQHQLTKLYAVNSNNTDDFIQTEEKILQIRTLYLFYEADKKNYYFGIKLEVKKNIPEQVSGLLNEAFLQERIENFAELPYIQALTSSDASDQKSDADSCSHREILRRIKSRSLPKKTVQRLVDAEFNAERNTFLLSIIDGISVGIFLEMLLWLLPASPLARFMFDRELVQKLEFSTFIESPYSFYRYYQSFLLRPTQFDALLDKFFDSKKPFTMGMLFGVMGGLVKAILNKAILNRDNAHQFLIMMGIGLSIMPTNYLLNERIESIQMIFRNLGMLFLAPRGLMHTINASLSCLSKIPEMARSLTDKMSEEIASCSFSFFTIKKSENMKNKFMTLSGLSFLPGKRACHY